MKPIVVLGSINMDLVSITNRAPAPGETVFGDDFQMYSGGKGANQAVAAARLGYPSILLGKVGSDVFGAQLVDRLNAEEVNTSEIERISGSTGTASIVVDSRGENSIIVNPGANQHVSPEYLESKQDIVRCAGIVLAQLEIPIPTIDRVAQLCQEFGVPLMLDPAPAQSLSTETLSRITWLTPNQSEAGFYIDGVENAGVPDLALLQRGVRNVILKQGAAGVIIAGAQGNRSFIEAFPVAAVDTTAAGDSFNGAFAVAQMRGMSLNESARYAAAAAAISVTRKGAQSSLPFKEEVDKFLAERVVVPHGSIDSKAAQPAVRDDRSGT